MLVSGYSYYQKPHCQTADEFLIQTFKMAILLFNNWLQRDLSILDESYFGESRRIVLFHIPCLFHYLSMELLANTLTKPFVDFFWKNKHKNLKDAVKAGEKAGGFDMLDFLDGNDNFKKITG